MRSTVCLSIVPAVLLAISASAQQQPEYFSVPGVDAPELARRGAFGVGVRTLNVVHSAQPDILHFDKQTGKAPTYDRPLTLEIWYPATIPPGQTESTTYVSAMAGRRQQLPAGVPATFEIKGKALREAPPVAQQRFPLVVVSHGYPGSRTFLSYLTENLASKGYVVAAIDHTDSVNGAVRGFESTLLNRTKDQLFTIDEIAAEAQKPESFLHGLVDSSRVAIVGYSMGGYGALASAGAGYSKTSAAAKLVPGGYFQDLIEGSVPFRALKHPNLKAMVALAPWGEQPPYNSWSDEGLAGITIPSLLIVGDQDDVAGFEQGSKRIFHAAVNSDRCMLVYENARHNVGGNPPPPGVALDFVGLESFDEPVWRKDRITAINQHFITAFLDLYLKGDESRRTYLHPATVKSNDGQWPLAPGQSAGAAYSSEDAQHGQTTWKGFQRRWAVGLEMHCAEPGQAGH